MKDIRIYEMQPWMLWQKVDEVLYLCDLRNDVLFTLQDSAVEIAWSIFSEKISVDDLIETMSQKYKVGHSIIQRDIENFLHELEANEVIKAVNHE